jgi:NADPH-dependent 2,4-dienoyl-CoA reductase/sulfur reductase-like enzyme
MRLRVIGGSDAGISAALRARELDPTVEVTVVVADRFLNFSTCPACGPPGTVCTPISGC